MAEENYVHPTHAPGPTYKVRGVWNHGVCAAERPIWFRLEAGAEEGTARLFLVDDTGRNVRNGHLLGFRRDRLTGKLYLDLAGEIDREVGLELDDDGVLIPRVCGVQR